MSARRGNKEIARIERFVRMGSSEGALEALASRTDEGLSEKLLERITGARNFWLAERQRRAGRRLHADTPGIIGFDLSTIGQRGSLTVVELPDHLDPSKRTTRYLDTSGEEFAGLGEDAFCTRAISTASQFYLALATQVDSANHTVRGSATVPRPAGGPRVQPA